MFQECHNFCAHCPVTFWWQSCDCNCSLLVLHAHAYNALRSGSPSNVLHSTSKVPTAYNIDSELTRRMHDIVGRAWASAMQNCGVFACTWLRRQKSEHDNQIQGMYTCANMHAAQICLSRVELRIRCCPDCLTVPVALLKQTVHRPCLSHTLLR